MWKRGLLWLVWLLGGGALGLFYSMVLFRWWFDLGFRQPLADWLASIGLGRVAGYWSLVWLHLIDWVLLGLAGGIIGLTVKRGWIGIVLAVSLDYVIVPMIRDIFEGINGVGMAWEHGFFGLLIFRDFLTIAVGISAAAVMRVMRRKREGGGAFPVEGAGASGG